MLHRTPQRSAARAIDRTYQAVDSSAVASTTARCGVVPAAVSCAAAAITSARILMATSDPVKFVVIGSSRSRTAAVTLSARSGQVVDVGDRGEQFGDDVLVGDAAQVDLDVHPRGGGRGPGGIRGRGHVTDHIGVADRFQFLCQAEDLVRHPDDVRRYPARPDERGGDGCGPGGGLIGGVLGQLVSPADGAEGVDVCLGQPQGIRPQPVGGSHDVGDPVGVRRVLRGVAVTADHGHQGGGLSRVQRGGGAPTGCRCPSGELLEEGLDSVVTHGGASLGGGWSAKRNPMTRGAGTGLSGAAPGSRDGSQETGTGGRCGL